MAVVGDRVGDLERENAKLRRRLAEREAELAEALEQQTATTEVLQVINSSPGHLSPVFDAVLEKATRLCEAPFGVLRTYDGANFHVAAANGDPKFTEWVLDYGPFAPVDDRSPLGRMVSGQVEVARFADAPGEDAHGVFPGFRAFVDASGMRSGVTVALRRDGTLLGTVTVYRQEVRPFSDKQIGLLQNFAAQAVIAMENARLLTETREGLEHQTATAQVLQVVNSSPGDLAPVFDAMLEKAMHLCQASGGALRSYESGTFHGVALRGVSPAFGEATREVRAHPESGLGHIERGERVVQIADIANPGHPRAEAHGRRAMVELGGIRTALWVALRKDDVLRGTFVLYRSEVRPFSEKQIALVENFAAQAVIAMENARLLTETREALEQQTATAEVLQVINSSPGALGPVFDAMLEKAMRLCDAAFGILNTYDRKSFHRVATRGVPPAYDEWRQGRTGVSGPRTGHARIIAGEEVVHNLDLMAEPAYRDGDPDRRAFVELAGARTGLIVSLRKEDTLLGVIRIYRQEVRPFTDKQIALLQNFAAQAVIAIENARLLTETREALEQQTATAEVLQVINSSPGDLGPVFDAMLEKAIHLCEAAFGDLGIFDGEQCRWVAAHGIPDFAEYSFPLRPDGNSPMEQLTRGEQLVHLADVRQSDAYRELPAFKSTMDRRAVRSLLVVPLRKDGALLGAIRAYRREVRPFSDKQIALMQNFAAQAVIAMENARLITETREALEQQTATAEVLQVINSSPGDLAPVFETILEKAHTLCGVAHGDLMMYDGEHFQGVAFRGTPEPFADLLRRPLQPTENHQRLLRGERLIHIPDVAAEERAGPLHRATVEAGYRALLMIPLRKDDVLLGYITARRLEVRPFSEKEIALLENFAAQAVIAMENARLLTETREALDQQTATAEVLQVINSSTGDLAPVFETILEKAHTLCGATYGGLVIRDRDGFHNVAARGDPQFVERWRQVRPLHPPPGSPLTRLMRGEKVIHLADASADDNYRNTTPPEIQELVEFGGLRTLLMVPLRTDNAFLGVITAYRLEVQPFTDKQIALLQNFAAQAVIAMENARLLTETREALEQQTATAEILQVINSSPGYLTPVFEAVLANAVGLCEAKFGTLYLCEADAFRAVATYNAPPAFAEARTRAPLRPPPDAPLGRVAATKQVAHIADIRTNRSYIERDPFVVDAAELGGFRTVLSVPMLKDKELIGAININRQEVRPFSEKQIALLENFAAQAVIAMENARLITETREALEQQTATAEVLQVINASPGELAPVFDAILEKAHKLCGVSHGSLQLFEDSRFRAVATRGVTEDVAARLRQPREPGPVGERLLAGARFHEIADQGEAVAQSPLPTQSGRIDWRQQGIARRLFVPLRHDTSLLGMIVAGRKEVRPFSDKEVLLLENFAQQAVIAMENARLLGELQRRTEEVAELNRGLEARVAEQVEELGRVGRLKRFLAPQLAELIVSQGDEQILESHRREIVVVFCDLRGYTAFTETAEPEEVLEFLREYHGALGPLVAQFEGTLDQFSGDGIMVFFNDPVPCLDPAERAVKMAMAMREAASGLIDDWRRHSYELGFGAGIAQGYATLGQIGFSERSGYTAIGTVCNLAARLCAEAKDGQILVSSRIAEAVEAVATLEDLGNLELKGLRRPVAAFNVTS